MSIAGSRAIAAFRRLVIRTGSQRLYTHCAQDTFTYDPATGVATLPATTTETPWVTGVSGNVTETSADGSLTMTRTALVPVNELTAAPRLNDSLDLDGSGKNYSVQNILPHYSGAAIVGWKLELRGLR